MECVRWEAVRTVSRLAQAGRRRVLFVGERTRWVVKSGWALRAAPAGGCVRHPPMATKKRVVHAVFPAVPAAHSGPCEGVPWDK